MPPGVRGFVKGHVHSEETKRKISQSKTIKITFNCDYCKKEASRKPCAYKLQEKHFCSVQCYAKYRKEYWPKEKHSRYGSGCDAKTKAKKVKARSDVNHAIRDGKLKRLPCMFCGNEKTEAHHHDYDKPLDVFWLCIKHHAEVHKNPHLLKGETT